MFFSLKEILSQWLGHRQKPAELPNLPPVAAEKPQPRASAPTVPTTLPASAVAPRPGAGAPVQVGTGRVYRHGIRQLGRQENLYALFGGEGPLEEEAGPESFAELLPTSLAQQGLAALLVAKHGLEKTAGAEPRTRQAKWQRYPPPQVELDLHGLTVAEATVRVESFVQTAHAKGLKTLRLITGKGLHSEEGRAVLPGITESQLLALQARGLVFTFRWEGGKGEPSGSVVVYLER